MGEIKQSLSKETEEVIDDKDDPEDTVGDIFKNRKSHFCTRLCLLWATLIFYSHEDNVCSIYAEREKAEVKILCPYDQFIFSKGAKGNSVGGKNRRFNKNQCSRCWNNIQMKEACMRAELLSHVRLFVTPWSLPSSSVQGISQARILQWVAMPFSRGSFRPRDQTRVSCVSCIGREILYH